MKFLTQYISTDRKVYKSNGPDMTDPSYLNETDISLMIDRFRKTKIPPRMIDIAYGHSPTAEEFENARMLIAEVHSNFYNLDANTKEMFNNDPSLYLEFISKEENLKESYEKGLIDRSSIDPSIFIPPIETPVTPEGPVVKTEGDGEEKQT